MSLMKKRTMTEARKAAARANGAHSRGPVTCEGRERIRQANLRHGLFSQARDVVLASLGENREDYEGLRQGLHDSFPAVEPSQRYLIDRLADAMWRLGRADGKSAELMLRRGKELAGDEVPPAESDFLPAADRTLRLETSAFREAMRIMNLLLKAQPMRQNNALPGLPQKMMKTKTNVMSGCGEEAERGNSADAAGGQPQRQDSALPGLPQNRLKTNANVLSGCGEEAYQGNSADAAGGQPQRQDSALPGLPQNTLKTKEQ